MSIRADRYRSLALVLALVACDEHDAPDSSAAVTGSAAPPPVEASASDFALVLLTEGAALVTLSQTGEVVVSTLAANGSERSRHVVAAGGTERRHVVAAASDSRLGVAWGRADGAMYATLGDPSTGEFLPPARLSESGGAPKDEEAVAHLSGGELIVLRRLAREQCMGDPARTCTGYGFRRLGAAGDVRGDRSMEVPSPCSRSIAGALHVAGRRYYGICARSERGVRTTVFTIQYEPRYAQADEVLAECTPIGMTAIGPDVLVTGRCGDGRRTARFRGTSVLGELSLDDVQASCTNGKLRLSAAGGFEATLPGPTDALEPLLPARLARADARAVWTGELLLVATRSGERVRLSRYRCAGSELETLN